MLNVNGLPTSKKRQKLAERIKNMTQLYAVYKKLIFKHNDIYRLKIKSWKRHIYVYIYIYSLKISNNRKILKGNVQWLINTF